MEMVLGRLDKYLLGPDAPNAQAMLFIRKDVYVAWIADIQNASRLHNSPSNTRIKYLYPITGTYLHSELPYD